MGKKIEYYFIKNWQIIIYKQVKAYPYKIILLSLMSYLVQNIFELKAPIFHSISLIKKRIKLKKKLMGYFQQKCLCLSLGNYLKILLTKFQIAEIKNK
jgi:hypothetical protein